MPDTNSQSASSRSDFMLRFFTPILTLITVIVGVYQFNKGQKENKDREIGMRQMEIRKMTFETNREILSKFKENQNKAYADMLSVIGYIATHNDYKDKKYQEAVEKFELLYWVGLAAVSTPQVDTAILKFHLTFQNVKQNNYRYLDDSLVSLQIGADNVANAMKISSRDYSLPGGLKGLEFNIDSIK